ncbi:hypothetical protein THAOC_34804 [Thalassiosira oceanica]|uniref:Uncharacterized protein n=1 Tax=Thalassiosira oceanica TaxID=159749 RepID=K0R1X5_THAOC|nr:hypothetical protein THAOC_34804 [Thalassiosira oceanica]|eukprot:EJK46523.1 hypothetical protein THAOC_34804 [Thalassiosira oceanica]
MLKTAKRYEEVPNRRYMITDEMRLHLSRRAQAAGRDSIEAVVFDWVTLGCYTGIRRSEAFQTKQKEFERVTDHPCNPPRALILEDFVILDRRKRVLDVPAEHGAMLHPTTFARF